MTKSEALQTIKERADIAMGDYKDKESAKHFIRGLYHGLYLSTDFISCDELQNLTKPYGPAKAIYL